MPPLDRDTLDRRIRTFLRISFALVRSQRVKPLSQPHAIGHYAAKVYESEPFPTKARLRITQLQGQLRRTCVSTHASLYLPHRLISGHARSVRGVLFAHIEQVNVQILYARVGKAHDERAHIQAPRRHSHAAAKAWRTEVEHLRCKHRPCRAHALHPAALCAGRTFSATSRFARQLPKRRTTA